MLKRHTADQIDTPRLITVPLWQFQTSPLSAPSPSSVADVIKAHPTRDKAAQNDLTIPRT